MSGGKPGAEKRMAYPRQCPVCRADYAVGGAVDFGHATVGSQAGGTPSPWRPEEPGRILTLRCLVCGDEYTWDYFADAAERVAREARGAGGAGRVAREL